MNGTPGTRFFKVALVAINLLVLVAPVAQGGSLNLSWNANSEPDLDGYKVYYGMSSGDYGDPIDVGNVTAYQLTGLSGQPTPYLSCAGNTTLLR